MCTVRAVAKAPLSSLFSLQWRACPQKVGDDVGAACMGARYARSFWCRDSVDRELQHCGPRSSVLRKQRCHGTFPRRHTSTLMNSICLCRGGAEAWLRSVLPWLETLQARARLHYYLPRYTTATDSNVTRRKPPQMPNLCSAPVDVLYARRVLTVSNPTCPIPHVCLTNAQPVGLSKEQAAVKKAL